MDVYEKADTQLGVSTFQVHKVLFSHNVYQLYLT